MKTKSVAKYPLCDVASDFEAVYPIPFQMQRGTSTMLKRKCRCRRPCSHSSYKISFDSWQTFEKMVTKVSFRPSNVFGRTITSEHFRYGFIKLLCDFGAVLGIHMGISLLTLTEFLEYLYNRISA